MKKYLLLIIIILVVMMPATKEIVDLIYKNNPTLSDRDNLELGLEQLVRDYILSGRNASFGTLKAQRGEFTIDAPLATAKLAHSTQAIANEGALKNIEWDSITYNYGGVINWSASAPTKIYIGGGHKERVVEVSVWCQWESNADGTRYIEIREFDSADVEVSHTPMLSQSGMAGAMYQTFSYPITIESTSAYISIGVWQDSGVELDIVCGCALTWFR